jgi:hypothetical protein
VRKTVIVGVLIVGLLAPAVVIGQGALSPAGATTALTCTKVKGNEADFTVIIAGCAGLAKIKATGSDGLVTWSKGGGTTTWDDTDGDVQSGPNSCGKHDLIWTVSGTVTGGTSTFTHVGDPVSFTLCGSPFGKSDRMHKLKGTNVSI